MPRGPRERCLPRATQRRHGARRGGVAPANRQPPLSARWLEIPPAMQGVTMTALLAKACGVALEQHPLLYASERLHRPACRKLRAVPAPPLNPPSLVGSPALAAGLPSTLSPGLGPPTLDARCLAAVQSSHQNIQTSAFGSNMLAVAPLRSHLPSCITCISTSCASTAITAQPFPTLTASPHPTLSPTACTPDASGVTYNEHINIAMAVAMPDGGLITPVLKDADSTDIYTLSRSWADLVRRGTVDVAPPRPGHALA